MRLFFISIPLSVLSPFNFSLLPCTIAGSVFGVPSIRYNAYGDGGTTTIEPEDEHRLAEDAGYIAMTSENRKEIFDLKVNSLKCEESAYAEIPAAMIK